PLQESRPDPRSPCNIGATKPRSAIDVTIAPLAVDGVLILASLLRPRPRVGQPLAQMFEVELDGRVGTHQLGQDLGARAAGLAGSAPVLEKRPQALANLLGQHTLEIFQRSSAQALIGGVQSA